MNLLLLFSSLTVSLYDTENSVYGFTYNTQSKPLRPVIQVSEGASFVNVGGLVVGGDGVLEIDTATETAFAGVTNVFVSAAGTLVAGCLLGFITFADYYGPGVLTVLTFYFLRGPKWYHGLMQAAALWYIHGEMLGGLEYLLPIGGYTLHISRQLFALAALPLLRLYRGEKGYSAKWYNTLYRAFYPAHMLLLAAAALLF